MKSSERNHIVTIVIIMVLAIVLVSLKNSIVVGNKIDKDLLLKEVLHITISIILVPFVLRMIQSDLFNFNDSTKFHDYLVIAGVCIAFGLIANDVIERASGIAKNSIKEEENSSLKTKLGLIAKKDTSVITDISNINNSEYPILVKEEFLEDLGLMQNLRYEVNDSLTLVERERVVYSTL